MRFVSVFCVSVAKERVCRWLNWNRPFRSALLRSGIKGSSCCAFKYTLRALRFHAIMLISGAFLAPFHYRRLIVSPHRPFLCTTTGVSPSWAARPAAAGRWIRILHRSAAPSSILNYHSSMLADEQLYGTKPGCALIFLRHSSSAHFTF